LLTWLDVDADDALAQATGQGHLWVLPFVAKVLEASDGFGDRVHDAGALLGVWIADDPDVARQLFELGADAVATNDPRQIVRVRDAVRLKREMTASRPLVEHMEKLTEELLTEELRASDGAMWAETRRFLRERGLDPSSCAVGGSFPEDTGEFTVLVDRDEKAYTYVLVRESGGPVLADWQELDEEGMDTYSEFVQVGRNILRASNEEGATCSDGDDSQLRLRKRSKGCDLSQGRLRRRKAR
jgi:hypothetical protein